MLSPAGANRRQTYSIPNGAILHQQKGRSAGVTAQSNTAIFTGGLDLASQALMIPNGNVIDCKNYEPGITGGYRRIDGYERYDGQAAPSAASYWNLAVNLSGSVAAGNTVTGASSGATGYVLQVNGATELIITALTGLNFSIGENITVSAAVVGVTTAQASINGATTLALHVAYRGLAASYYRALIQPVPGSGNILGVKQFNGTIYAWRNNVGATKAVMYASSASSWQAVAMPYEVSYTGGSGAQPAVGTTITQGGVSGTLKAITVQSGTFTGSNAWGRLIFLAISGGSFTAAAFTAGITATCGGAQVQFSFLPGGSFQFDTYNFSGVTGASKMYGVDGVNPGFEFDGTTLVPIRTGMSPDTPNYVRCYLNQLCYAYAGIFQNSAVGNPYNWTLVLGAGQIALGDNITVMLPQVGTQSTGCMVICTRHSTWALYGSGTSSWSLVPISWDVGCVPGMAVQMTQPYFFSDRGLTALKAVLAFGNFERSILTEKIQTWIQSKIGMGTTACVVRQKSHLRYFFNDGTFLIVGFVGGIAGDTGQYGYAPDEQPDLMIGTYQTANSVALPVLCVDSSETATGTEMVMFGSNAGYVYQADMGTSFDGNPLEAWIRSAYDAIGGPRVRKRFFSGEFEVKITDQMDVQIGYDTWYANPDSDITPQAGFTIAGAGGSWDSFTWDQFTWDAAVVVTQDVDCPGRGNNISWAMYSNTTNDSSWTLFSVTTRYENIRLMR